MRKIVTTIIYLIALCVGVVFADASFSFSQVSGVSDITSPPPFDLLSPANNARISDNTPTLEWGVSSDEMPSTDHYEVWLDGVNVDNVLGTATFRPSSAELVPPSPQGHMYYVSPTGSDKNSGSISEPLRTIQKAAELMKAGDICYVREGTYRETVRLNNSGSENRPIKFVAYPSEVVFLSGTEPITGSWVKYTGSIYKTKVENRFVQLFVDGRMMTEARWPNIRSHVDIFDRKTWATADPGNELGKMVDSALVGTDVDWTGALATLNVQDQWWTWTRRVNQYSVGGDTFTYDNNLNMVHPSQTSGRLWEHDYYYLSGKLEALDTPGEWFLTEDNMLYLWVPDGKDPSLHGVEVKMRNYAFEAENLDYVDVMGFNFSGCTFKFENCNHFVVDSCHLLYPTYSKKTQDRTCMNGLGNDPPSGDSPVTYILGEHNTIRNCTLAYSNTYGLEVVGSYNTVENNVIHDVNWSGAGNYPAIKITAPYWVGFGDPLIEGCCVVRHNTIYRCGSMAIRFDGMTNNVMEYNDLHHCQLLGWDSSTIEVQLPNVAGTVIQYNWVHDCSGWAIRADGGSREVTFHHNVLWNVEPAIQLVYHHGMEVNGDRNKIYNNTLLGCKLRIETKSENYYHTWTCGWPPLQWHFLDRQNANSIAFNNCIKKGKIEGSAGSMGQNYEGSNPQLTDPSNLDFRPKAGSLLIDAGVILPNVIENYEGSAPDIGAYEYGGEYWVPGCRQLIYSRYTTSPLDTGGHTWYVIAVDATGNERKSDTFTFEVVKPASFELSDLSVSKTTVEPGEGFTASVVVANVGGEEGPYTVELSIDGQTMTSDVTLGPGASETVTFEVSLDEEGTYAVSAGGMSKSVEVSAPGQPEGEGFPVLPVAGVVVVAVAVGVLVWRRWK